LDACFLTARDIITKIPILQQTAFLKEINSAISCAHPQASILLDQTLIKAKKFVEANEYMDHLTSEIAWAMITSHDFIHLTSPKEWLRRKEYFTAMIALWHKIFLEGNELDSFRIIDKQYHAYIAHLVPPIKPAKNVPLKSGSDLCDSQLIHYASLGIKSTKLNIRLPVICITKDSVQTIEHRVAISKKTLYELNRDVEGWNIYPTAGEVLCLNIQKKEIENAQRIYFNTSFKK
jgi:hypothetical protein